MATPEEVAQRIENQKLKDKYYIPIDEGLHLQNWLITQETENTGCPLLDTPFFISGFDND
jgi:hypothetical protein